MTPATSCVNRTERPTDWNAVKWRQANRNVRRLRQRIFRATQEEDWDKVQSLQRLMLRSRSNCLVSVRRVTQLNQGRRTPGVDKLVVKTPARRGRLVDEIATYQPWNVKPTRRLYIPKANGNLRPLGIPTVIDRCLQTMVKNALEPSWEARFEASSYGFRPGRGCHDAIAKIALLAAANRRKKWVIDADIKGAFDNIDHEHLLQTIGPVPGRELIRRWLKAGYVEDGVFHPTTAGTPQGGTISPLLANIALHGMEQALAVTRNKRGVINSNRALVKYADDFVVFCESEEDAQVAQSILTEWLAKRGLVLSTEKTRIVQLTEGFDFLGFNIRQYKVTSAKSGYKLLIKPSKQAVYNIRQKLRAEWRKLNGHNVSVVLSRLNPIIRGEANYYRMVSASRTFKSLDRWMFIRCARYVNRSHPNKPNKWRRARYWGVLNQQRRANWVFGDKQSSAYLLQFAWFNIRRHVLVKGAASPDDPSLQDYWAERASGKRLELTLKEQRLARKQNYVCPMCGDSLFNGEEIHQHHVQPRKAKGADTDTNYRLVHLYCHQQIHSGIDTPLDAAGQLLLL